MDELVNLIVTKTGIPAATAKNVVQIVVDYLKKRLPAPMASQVDAVLSSPGNIKTAQDMLGSLGAKIGKKK